MEYHYPNDGSPDQPSIVTFCFGVRPDGIDVPEGTAGLSERCKRNQEKNEPDAKLWGFITMGKNYYLGFT